MQLPSRVCAESKEESRSQSTLPAKGTVCGLPPPSSLTERVPGAIPQALMPEENVTAGKQQALARMARHFLRDWRLANVPWRFDLLAIENRPGVPPIVRLHKDALPQSGAPRRR